MPIYTVSQISDAIKKTLEGSFGSLQIKGEISNLRVQSSGHYYFTLKDETAQISCALFRGDALRLKQAIKDGDQILAIGSISVFAPKGTYQLIVKEIQLQGLGDLLLKLEALKQKFKALGYFDPSRKKQIPRFAKTIGVITSPTGAVIQDIIQTLTRRHKGFRLILIPTKVQGEGSSDEIAYGIEIMNRYNLCDLIIVGRGGGSLEDLWCFNDEKVVEAIYRSKIPIISAVGHETDFTLCDFVADLRAPTPTAAAEISLFDTKEFLNQIKARFDAISKLFHKRIAQEKLIISHIKKRPEFVSPSMILQGFYFSLDRIQTSLEQKMSFLFQGKKASLESKKLELSKLSPQKLLDDKKMKLQAFSSTLSHLMQKLIDKQSFELHHLKNRWQQTFLLFLDRKKARFETTIKLLDSIDPENVMSKGYAILQTADGQKTLTQVFDVQDSSDLRIKMKDGSILVKVKQKSMV